MNRLLYTPIHARPAGPVDTLRSSVTKTSLCIFILAVLLVVSCISLWANLLFVSVVNLVAFLLFLAWLDSRNSREIDS